MESAFHRNLLSIALMVSPLVFVSLYLWADGLYGLPPKSSIIAMTAGVAVGSFGVWLIPTRRSARIAALVVYIPTAILSTFLWGALIACSAFQRCL